jgi:hypothetical protein
MFMPEVELWKVSTSLGIPGLALCVFYMLFRQFKWKFSVVPSIWVGPIIILFMLLSSLLAFYTLTLWASASDFVATAPIQLKPNDPNKPDEPIKNLPRFIGIPMVSKDCEKRIQLARQKEADGDIKTAIQNYEIALKLCNKMDIERYKIAEKEINKLTKKEGQQ